MNPSLIDLLTNGEIATLPLAQPAAGADFSTVLAQPKLWIPLIVTAQLVTDATVAARRSTLVITQGTGFRLQAPNTFTQSASLTVIQQWAVFAAATGANGGAFQTVLPFCPLRGAHTVATATLLLAAGDQWSSGLLTYLYLP